MENTSNNPFTKEIGYKALVLATQLLAHQRGQKISSYKIIEGGVTVVSSNMEAESAG